MDFDFSFLTFSHVKKKAIKALHSYKRTRFVQSLELLKKSGNLQFHSPDLEKLWKIKISLEKNEKKYRVLKTSA